MLIEKAQPPDHAFPPMVGSPTIGKMLIAKRYDQVDELLAQAQQSLRSTAHNPVVDNILHAARQICLSCKALHDTAEWHRQASQEARHQEQNLSQLLQIISDLIYADNLRTPPKSTANGYIRSNTPHNLWRRIQHMFLGQTSIPASLLPTSDFTISADQRSTSPTSHVLIADDFPSPTPTTESLPVAKTESTTVPAIDSDRQPAPETHQPHHTFIIYGLGYFRLYHNEELIDNWSHRKAKTLFKYLLWHRQHPIPKEVLMDLFWPDIDIDAARNNLNVTIYNLRQILRQSDASCSYILFQNDAYVINPELTIWVDYEAFLEHFHKAQRFANCGQLEQSLHAMRSAESLYQGELFEDDPYDDWIMPQRHTLHNHYIEILNFLSCQAFSEHDYAACIMFCNKQLLVDSCCEDAHRRLMQCYVAFGQHYLAMRQYHECVEQLQTNLDVAPSPKTVELYEEIRAIL